MPRKATPKLEAMSVTAELESRLRYTFRQPALLTLALTHRSFVYDAGVTYNEISRSDPSRDNEQFEFLGDAILGLLVAEALCRRFPASREGDLTRLRASLVSRRSLGEVGLRLDIGRSLRLGRTTEENGGRSNASLASNAVEAIIAAIYLDGGLEAARGFVEREILVALDQPSTLGALPQASLDYKTALQEYVQSSGLGRPHYLALGESGPDHRRIFHVGLRLEGAGPGFGQLAEAAGPTKKQAQQEAARLALAILHQRCPGDRPPA